MARYYRTDTAEYRPVSNEITGYAASAFLHLYRLTGRGECLDAALRAGRYLTRTAWNPVLATMPFECRGQGERAYFFDLGIVARALLALWRATREEEFLAAAAACAKCMAVDFRGPSGYIPVLALPEKRPVPGDGGWSQHPGCYQLKAALAFHELAGAGLGSEYQVLYEEIAESLLPTHADFLASEPDRQRRMDRLHAYCYFLEGLLARLGGPGRVAALGEGIERVGRLLREIRPVFERSDVWAQLLRLRLYAAALGAVPLDEARAEEEAAAIPGFQSLDSDRRAGGAFSFGRKGGALMPFANPVSTAFALQALTLWEEHRAGRFRAEVQALI